MVLDGDVLHVRMKNVVLHHANHQFVVQEDCHHLIKKLVIVDLCYELFIFTFSSHGYLIFYLI
jgi:hypothetical protein